MANLVEPFLEKNERSMLSFTAKRGPSPWLPIGVAALAGTGAYQSAALLPFDFFGMCLWVGVAVGLAVLTALNLFLYKPRIIAVTNKSIVALQADTLNGTPTTVLCRLPRETEIGPARGIHAKTTIDGERLWVPLRWRALLDVSDRGRPSADTRKRSGTAADRRAPQGESEDATIDLRRPAHGDVTGNKASARDQAEAGDPDT